MDPGVFRWCSLFGHFLGGWNCAKQEGNWLGAIVSFVIEVIYLGGSDWLVVRLGVITAIVMTSDCVYCSVTIDHGPILNMFSACWRRKQMFQKTRKMMIVSGKWSKFDHGASI